MHLGWMINLFNGDARRHPVPEPITGRANIIFQLRLRRLLLSLGRTSYRISRVRMSNGFPLWEDYVGMYCN